ncbi:MULTISPECIES: GNAT family N-acetyltransferase [unclassified Microbacterium]|uniref:GNAT family N-acetyltransferase n=1 Tax=unclassified Microbacterium TaxID=2609290 RepID=UPI00214C6123|nr:MULTISPECIES: GNAT family N-acetyltransferase [unclassified Microbacterium]MCR2784591.1 GNAT family N-acetyltransferase [Microbacterium sp. zg.B96]MDL5350490.1 GNAT family N-acetyltransferase [Microbacterium sp. zg-YB36]WIM14601.1 GNAT family N-acetyltransferase [Microbacterium sp. zg-B96]
MIELRPLTGVDVDAHNAGEDDEVVRWLSGQPATHDSTRRHFAMLADNASRATGKRGFGVWLEGKLAGYIDFDPGADDLPAAGDVNISYAIHPWARQRGVATSAVLLLCDYLAGMNIGKRAIIRAQPLNTASVRVAERSGFRFLAEISSTHDYHPDGSAVIYATYALDFRDDVSAC